MRACWRWSAISPTRCARAARRRKPTSRRRSPNWSAPRPPRRRDHIRLSRRPHPRRGRCRPCRRPRNGHGRPRHGAGDQVGARDRLSGWRAGFSRRESYGYLPPDKVLALCTGSQGEPRAALARIAEDEHPEVTLGGATGDLFRRAPFPATRRPWPCHQRPDGQGVEVITDRTHLVHVSGHPRRAELLDMIGWVRPKILIPAHGEALHWPSTPRSPAAPACPSPGLPQRRSGAPRAGPRKSSTKCRRAVSTKTVRC